MPTLSELFVELKLSADSFNNGLKAAQKEAKEFEKNIKPTLEATKQLGIVMGAAGGAIVAGMGAASKAAIDYGDKLNDARQRTGATVETLAKLGFAAEQSGSSFEGMSTGLKFLAKNMETAISKGGEQRAAFNELGISSKDLASANGDVNKVFELLADRFKELPDGTEKSALAMRVFGKAGADLIPLLNEGSAGIQQLGRDAERAGIVVGQDFASAADQLNDTLNEVEKSMLGASIGIAQGLLPALQTVALLAAEATQAFGNFTKEHPVLVQAVGALGVALVATGGALTAIAVIVPKVQLGFQLLTTAMAGPAGVVVAIGAAVIAVGAIIYAYKQWSDAADNLEKQLREQTKSTQTATDALKKHGIQVDLSGKNEAQQAEAIAKAGKELQAKLKATEKSTEATKTHTKAIVDEAAQLKAQEAAIKKAKEAQEQVDKELRVALDLEKVQVDLLKPLTALQYDFGKALREAADSQNKAAREMASFTGVVNAAVAGMEQARYNAEEMDKDFASLAHADPGVNIGKGFESAADAIKKSTDEAKKLDQATADIKNSAGKIFDDMFIKGENVFSSLGNALKGGALSLGRSIFEDVTASLLGPVKKAFDDFFEGLLDGVGFKKLISGLGDSIGGALSGLFGGGSSTAAGAATTAAGGVSSSAGGLASTATGVLGGVVSGVISAVGSVLAGMRLEGTMNAVEANTRFTYIELRDTMELILQPMKARLEDILAELFNHKYLPDLVETLGNGIIESVNNVGGSISNLGNSIAGAVASALEGISIPQAAAVTGNASASTSSAAVASTPGGNGFSTAGLLPPGFGSVPALAGGTPFVTRGGLAQLHRGEAVVPANQNRMGSGITVNVYQRQETDSEFARRIADALSRYVDHAGGRLVSSEVRR